jgi:hypothetical protein
MIAPPVLSRFDAWLDELIAAEQTDGWLAACVDRHRYLVASVELVEELAVVLHRLAAGRTVLEVCAGAGHLAAALSAQGLAVRAVDVAPGAGVEQLAAHDALRRYRPAVVLGAFVPVDAGVDQAVLHCAAVQHYVVLGARLGGLLGSAALWNRADWRAEPLHGVTRRMLTRHDVWLGPQREQLLRRGEAWHFRRAAAPLTHMVSERSSNSKIVTA